MVNAAQQAGQRRSDDEGGERDDDGDLRRYADHDDVRGVKTRRFGKQDRSLVVVVVVLSVGDLVVVIVDVVVVVVQLPRLLVPTVCRAFK